MLHRVVMGQARFNLPGLTADGRGAAVGRQMVLRFLALDRLVAFLRLWSAGQALDDLQPGLRLIQVREASGPREVLVLVAVTSAALADAVARAARTVGGQSFTGGGKHFALARDSRAPLGYDVSELDASAGAAADFVLYDHDVTLSYMASGDLPLDKLLLRLDLQRLHGALETPRDALFLTVRRGLGPMVIEYLHRVSRTSPSLRVAAAMIDAPDGGGAFRRGNSFWILRLEEVPARLLGMLSRTPGLALFAPVADNVVVAVGYRHPVHLASCKQVFSRERLFLFAPRPAGVTAIDPAPVFSPVADLVRLQPAARSPWAADAGGARRAGAESPAMARARAPEALGFVIPMRLEAAPSRPGRAVATIVPWDQLAWLRALCYALPPSVLRGHRLAVLERGLLVLAPDVLAGFPFGQLLHAPAPGLLVPLGWELRPAVSPVELAARIKATGGALVVFPAADQTPFRIGAEAIESLEARALGDPRLQDVRVERAVRPVTVEEPIPIEIANQPLGPMPLWRLGRVP